MDKSGFLRELEKHLIVLSESEQKDISDEYTQHIDMKMENGMSETEAIRDFGDIEELASEILKAYHVNPRYGNKKRLNLVQREEIPVQELKKTGVHIWRGIVGAVKKLCSGVWSAVKVVCAFLAAPFAAAWNTFKHRKEAAGERRSNRLEVDLETGCEAPRLQKDVTAGKIIGKAGYGMSGFIRAIGLFIVACVRWFWNGCVLLAALITGAITLTGIFCMGVMAVLLLQGYPLAGVTLAGLGGAMFSGSVTLIMFCLLRRKNRENGQPVEKEVEVQEVSEDA